MRLLLLALCGLLLPAAASATPADGDDGRQVYARHCASCHGAALEGAAGPPLAGAPFRQRWSGTPKGELLAAIAQLMPQQAAGSLSPAQYQAVYGFVLSQGGLREGAAGLEPAAGTAAAAAEPPPVLPAPPRLLGNPAGPGPVTADLVAPAPGDWPFYNRDYRGHRFSPLDQITPANVQALAPRCIFQAGEVGSFQASPVLQAGRLYVTTTHNTYAVDARTCRKVWEHSWTPQGVEQALVNRGPALYGGRLFRGTPDGHLLALDAQTGALLWDVRVADGRQGYSITAAPAVFEGKVIVGESGADRGATGRVHAFEAATGKLLWSFNMAAAPGEPGGDSWQGSLKERGASSWSTITVDPQERRVYVPVGNPGSALDGSERPGDNLYTNAIVVLDADTGRLAWHVQQVPHDVWDWDTAAAPVLYEAGGRRLMAVASKDGWLYLYDRDTRKLLSRQETTTHRNADVPPDRDGTHVCPGTLGGTEWFGPALDPRNGLLFVSTVDWCVTLTVKKVPGFYFGGTLAFDPLDTARGWVRAFDAATGQPRWTWQAETPMVAGLTPTAGGLLFTGTLNGDLLAFEARSGRILYRFNTGGAIAGGITSYALDGRQYLAVASGNASRTIWQTKGAATLVVFGLP